MGRNFINESVRKRNAVATINTKEIDKIIVKLEAVKDSFSEDTFETILAEAAEPARDKMQAVAPKSKKRHTVLDDGGTKRTVNPGNLKRSIQIFKAKKGKQKVALVGPVVSKKSKITRLKGGPKVSRAKRAFYWMFVYYGTARQAPQRFIDVARSQSESAVLSKLRGGITKYLDKKIQKIFD